MQTHATCHSFLHLLATRLLESGYDIRTVRGLPEHKDVGTTMIYTHVLNRGPGAARSPADSLAAADDLVTPIPLLPQYPATVSASLTRQLDVIRRDGDQRRVVAARLRSQFSKEFEVVERACTAV